MAVVHIPATFDANVRCPVCEEVVEVPISLHGRLVTEGDGSGEMKVRLMQKKVPHRCEDSDERALPR